jgi:hypothetical protein
VLAVRPRAEGPTTSQGSSYGVFRKSIEAGNVVAAEIAARELRGLSLADALDLTALVALRDRTRSRRMTARRLQRWLDEMAGVTIDEAAMVVGCLATLRGPGHDRALNALRTLDG